jgi:hypothetical protein
VVIGVSHQRMAESIRIVASRSDLLAQNIFVLVHFDKAKPDQGRKTLQSRLMELAQIIADDAVQYLLRQGGLLKPAGEKTTSAQRAVEKSHEDWVDNVKANAKDNPLSIAPLCYVSTPITEQDVVGLFHQFAALGLFAGLKILATSAAHTYDCYAQFDCKQGVERLRYTEHNPLGLSADIFGVGDPHFSTKGLTLEFKKRLSITFTSASVGARLTHTTGGTLSTQLRRQTYTRGITLGLHMSSAETAKPILFRS